MFEQTFQVRFNGRWPSHMWLEFDPFKLICTSLYIQTIINSFHVNLKLCLNIYICYFARIDHIDLFTRVSPISCRDRIKIFASSWFALLTEYEHAKKEFYTLYNQWIHIYINVITIYFIFTSHIWIHNELIIILFFSFLIFQTHCIEHISHSRAYSISRKW